MAADIHGAVARGTKSGSDFSVHGLATAPLAGWVPGLRYQPGGLWLPLSHQTPPRRSPDRTCPHGLHPRHIVLFPVFSSFSFLLSLSSLCSLLLSSSLLFSLPFLPLLQPVCLHRVSFSYIRVFLLFTLIFKHVLTTPSLSVPLLDSGRSQIPYTWPCS